MKFLGLMRFGVVDVRDPEAFEQGHFGCISLKQTQIGQAAETDCEAGQNR
jgi:hypothetical protein